MSLKNIFINFWFIYKPWIICAASLIQFSLIMGVLISYNEFLLIFNHQYNQSAVWLDWIGAVSLCLPMTCAPLASYVHKKLQTRKTVILGVFICTMSISFNSLQTKPNMPQLFFTYSIMFGIGASFILNPPFFILDTYFPLSHPRHVLSTSLIACAFPIGSLIFTPMAYLMLIKMSYQMAYVIYAIIIFIIGLPCGMVMVENENYSEGEFLVNNENDEEGCLTGEINKRTLKIISSIWLLASFFKSFAYYTPFIVLIMHMNELGISKHDSMKGMISIAICELITRLAISYYGDRIKGKFLAIYCMCTFCLAILNCFGAYAKNIDEMILYGCGAAGGPVIAAMYSSCGEVLQGRKVPYLFTLFRFGLGLGTLIGPSMAGLLYDAMGSYHYIFFINSAIYLITCLLYMFVILLNKYRPDWAFPKNSVNENRTKNEMILTRLSI